jgi:hypothetical protein
MGKTDNAEKEKKIYIFMSTRNETSSLTNKDMRKAAASMTDSDTYRGFK